jgi:ADP-ribose pyrophosphatase YjhB (NUDIX family)
MIWKPNVTVAAVAVRDGKHLLVEEKDGSRLVLNQPAGHLDEGESLLDAVVRETLEETAWHFVPEFLIGVYRWPYPEKGVTYLRFAFAGRVTDHEPGRALDRGVVRALWLTPREIAREAARHRSPQVQRTLDDFLAGRCYPLDLLSEVV